MDSNTKDILILTDSARRALQKLSDDNNANIRLGVKPGGCAGFKYDISFASEALPFEETISISKNSKLFIDVKAIMYLIESEMDYEEDDFKAGFSFRNPNEKSKCGCGKSFGVQ